MRTKEIIQRLGISKSLLYKYVKDFNLNPVKNHKDQLEFSEIEFNLLDRVVCLRNESNGIDTITKKLNLQPENIQEIDKEYPENIPDNSEALINSLQGLEKNLIRHFDSLKEIVFEYSRATEEIGYLKGKLEAKEDKISLICSGYEKDILSLKNEISKKNLEIINLREENLTLRDRLNVKWWKKRVF